MLALIRRLFHEESGHNVRAATGLLGAPGAIVLGVGASAGNDVLIWIGAVVVALAFINVSFIEHVRYDYPLLERIEDLEAK